MKESLKANEIAGRTATLSHEPHAEASRGTRRPIPTEQGTAQAESQVLLVSSDSGVATAERPSTTEELPRTGPIARVLDGLVGEAAFVRRLHADSLAVVLKPDGHTEIFVRLEMRDGQLEASARCDRGDFQFLSGQWPQLQRALQQQGVRLFDLQARADATTYDSGASADGSPQNRQAPYPQPEERAVSAFRPAPADPGAAARRARFHFAANRLLESWA